LDLRIASELANVALLGGAIRAACEAVGLTVQAASEVELSVVEAVNNVIEHAYGLASDGQVWVSLEVEAGSLEIEICDRGEAMPASVLASASAPRFDPTDLPQLPEGGMGLGIVTALMDEVRYRSDGGQNVLTLIRRLG
jgi:serine/threonine-protein kinase RsbW